MYPPGCLSILCEKWTAHIKNARAVTRPAAVREAAEFAAPAHALVVALGVDAAAGDPESPLEVTAAGYREAGRILGELGLPTVVVQEGGYDLATIGPLVVETLSGLATV